jgi:molybdopterin-guanine dinucleotide biosynthesis protein B
MKSSGEKRTMIPIISIVGRSKSGKTTLIEHLIPEFMERGYRVATIKHHGKDFQIDQAGKDSWRHKQAGAQTVVISSPQKVALIEDVSQDLSLDDLATRFIQGADIIIAEGFKRDKHPKIEVFRKEIDPDPLAPELENVLAIVSDCPLSMDIPCMDFNDIKGIADVIEERVILIHRGSNSTRAGKPRRAT